MTTDAEPLVHVDRHGLDIDEAVAFYERVYSSEDISVGRSRDERFTWRFRAVGDDEVARINRGRYRRGMAVEARQPLRTIGKRPAREQRAERLDDLCRSRRRDQQRRAGADDEATPRAAGIRLRCVAMVTVNHDPVLICGK